MFVQVIPFLRLPRSLTVFDYQVPSVYLTKVEVGSLVQIPWRNKKIWGIVLALQETTLTANPSSLIKAGEFKLNPSVLRAVLARADKLYLPPSTLLNNLLPELTWQKRDFTVPTANDDAFAIPVARETGTISIPTQDTFFEINDQRQRFNLYRNLVAALSEGEQILFLVPDKISGDLILQSLKQIPSLFTGALSKSAATWHWRAVASGRSVTVGTKKALLLPYQNLKYIVVDQEASQHHRQWDQAPRYDVLPIARAVAEGSGAALLGVDVCPSAYFYKGIQEKRVTYKRLTGDASQLRMVERPNNHWLALPIQDLLKNRSSLTGQTVWMVNRRGGHTMCICGRCGQMLTCPLCGLPVTSEDEQITCRHCLQGKIEKKCLDCGSVGFTNFGLTLDEVGRRLRKLGFSDIGYFDADSQRWPTNQIVVATSACLPQLLRTSVRRLFLPSFEQFMIPVDIQTEWQAFYLLAYLRSLNKPVIVQSRQSESMVTIKPAQFMTRESRRRLALKLPPYGQLLKVIVKNRNKTAVMKRALSLQSQWRQKFPRDTIWTPFYSQPSYRDGTYRCHVIIHPVNNETLDEITKISYPDIVFDLNPPQLLH
ncbi:MAG: hypothetical protein NUV82_04095 [Candidatus Komeilibacteria bacterium]|nr:hypothetical protein [Candidatus Komeilibacteria bacterium]